MKKCVFCGTLVPNEAGQSVCENCYKTLSDAYKGDSQTVKKIISSAEEAVKKSSFTGVDLLACSDCTVPGIKNAIKQADFAAATLEDNDEFESAGSCYQFRNLMKRYLDDIECAKKHISTGE